MMDGTEIKRKRAAPDARLLKLGKELRSGRVNTMNDVLFKFIFGRPERKGITIDFLNALLVEELEAPIRDLTFSQTEKVGSTTRSKVTRFDVACELSTGQRVDIEVQVANEKNIVRRTLFYWARLYSNELQEGEDYRQLKPAITINILNFRLFEDDPEPFSSWSVSNLRTHKRISKDLSIHFLEIPKFTPRRDCPRSNGGWRSFPTS